MSFDFGNTLADLDTAMLAARLLEKDVRVTQAALDEAQRAAWQAYNSGILQGGGGHPWGIFMSELLRRCGVERPDVVEWLHAEQPKRNLWRRPVPGMIELVRSLKVPVAVISNSEGKLRELAREMGWEGDFAVMADSGTLGVEKPDPRIFQWTAEHLGVAPAEIVHVGDSWPADVQGALTAGFQAIHFRGPGGPASAEELRRLLAGESGLQI